MLFLRAPDKRGYDGGKPGQPRSYITISLSFLFLVSVYVLAGNETENDYLSSVLLNALYPRGHPRVPRRRNHSIDQAHVRQYRPGTATRDR